MFRMTKSQATFTTTEVLPIVPKYENAMKYNSCMNFVNFHAETSAAFLRSLACDQSSLVMKLQNEAPNS